MTASDGAPTGHLDAGPTLVLTRSYRAPIGDVWASVTESDRLARWFGTWAGDPADGYVMVTMTAEAEDAPAARYDITACEPPRRLGVDTTGAHGRWQLTLELSERAGTTTLVLRQHEIDLGMVPDIGPGWEWYLDRLRAAIDGSTPPDLAAFDDHYLAFGEHYRSLVATTGHEPGAAAP